MMKRHKLKPLFQIQSHVELAEACALVLKNDGREVVARFLHETDRESGKRYIELLANGTHDADIPFSGGYINTLLHFHHPWSHRGYLLRKSSADVTAAIYKRAVSLWRRGEQGEAFYQLGRALHLLQDIFIPQHSGITGGRGHGQLEKWLTHNWRTYQVQSGGRYVWEKTFADCCRSHLVSSRNPYDWIDHGSHLSIAWYERFFASGSYSEDTFRTVAPWVVAYALRFSAGFLNLFCEEIAD